MLFSGSFHYMSICFRSITCPFVFVCVCVCVFCMLFNGSFHNVCFIAKLLQLPKLQYLQLQPSSSPCPAMAHAFGARASYRIGDVDNFVRYLVESMMDKQRNDPGQLKWIVDRVFVFMKTMHADAAPPEGSNLPAELAHLNDALFTERFL